jgi:hypothetical protein
LKQNLVQALIFDENPTSLIASSTAFSHHLLIDDTMHDDDDDGVGL